MKQLLNSLKISTFNITIVIYAVILAVLIVILKYLEYRYIVRLLSMEIYLGLAGVLCTALGIWIGARIVYRKPQIISTKTTMNTNHASRIGISKRELEVLELIAQGHSNQEIAEKLFISVPTVKTHSSNLFVKLNVKRRTQAIQKAKELKIIN